MLKELILGKILDEGYAVAKKIATSLGVKVISEKKDLELSIEQHIKWIENWCSQITFKESGHSIDLNQVYVDLDLYLTPVAQNINFEDEFCMDEYEEDEDIISERLKKLTKGRENTIKFSELIEESNKNLIILGKPGAGKTTSAKKISQKLLTEDKFLKDVNFPIVIRLKDLVDSSLDDDRSNTLYARIGNTIGLSLSLKQNDAISINSFQSIINRTLDELKVLIILDGFDELGTGYNCITDEIENLMLSLTSSRVYLTSRTGEYEYCFENSDTYELCPLTYDQIRTFIKNWLTDTGSAKKFLSDLKNTPYIDSSVRPLTLAHLCAIYKKYKKIPDKPKSVYKRICYLFIEEWDSQRGLERKSKFINFDSDQKFDFLCHIAYLLKLHCGNSSFGKNNLETIYYQIADEYNLPKREMDKVLSEIESHSGIFVKSGYESYEFSHLSIQEYLSAEYLNNLPSIPSDAQVLENFPNELAIALSLSSNPSLYLYLISENLVQNKNKILDIKKFLKVFITRIFIEKPNFKQSPFFTIASINLSDIDREFILKNFINKYDTLFTKSNFLFNENYQYIESTNTFKLIDPNKLIDSCALPANFSRDSHDFLL